MSHRPIWMTLVVLMAFVALAACSSGSGSNDTAAGGDTSAADVAGDVSTDGTLPTGDTAGTDGSTGGDGTTGDDTFVPPDSCELNSDCNPPALVCVEGSCVAGCSESNPCLEDEFCVLETGVCMQQCLEDEECRKEGYYCDNGTWCMAGCPWTGCDVWDQQCDPVSGRCTMSLCQWEVESGVASEFYGLADPQAPLAKVIPINVMQFVPFDVTIDVALIEGSDPSFAIDGAGKRVTPPPPEEPYIEPIELPYVASAGDNLVVQISFAPETTQGAFAALNITADATICRDNPVPVLAEGSVSCISLDPPELDLGTVTVGDPARGTVRLVNDCRDDVEIVHFGFLQGFTDWRILGDYEGQTVAGHSSLDLDFYLVPTIPAIRNSKLFIVTDHPENRVIPLMLKGAATMPID